MKKITKKLFVILLAFSIIIPQYVSPTTVKAAEDNAYVMQKLNFYNTMTEDGYNIWIEDNVLKCSYNYSYDYQYIHKYDGAKISVYGGSNSVNKNVNFTDETKVKGTVEIPLPSDGEGKRTVSFYLKEGSEWVGNLLFSEASIKRSEEGIWSISTIFRFKPGQNENAFYEAYTSRLDPSKCDGSAYETLWSGTMEEYEKMEEFVLDLIKDCPNDMEKVRVIHNWISGNIAYDNFDLGTKNEELARDAAWVYKNKRAVCAGYARLGRLFFGIANIPSTTVLGDGDILANENKKDVKDFELNHVWSMVYVNDKWHLIDLTWDAQGHYFGDGDSRNIDNGYVDYYFCITPEELGVYHYSMEGADYIDLPYKPQTISTDVTKYTKELEDGSFNLNVSNTGDGTLVYSVPEGQDDFVEVDERGNVTSKLPGTATISVYAAATEVYKKSNVINITINVYCNHDLSRVIAEEIPATCASIGKEAVIGCSKCPYTEGGANIAKLSHKGGTATCTKKAVCTLCGKEYGQLKSHSFATTWSSDVTNHWKECECGEKKSVAKHTFDNGKVTKEATVTEEGIKTVTCTICGHAKTYKIPKKKASYVVKSVELSATEYSYDGKEKKPTVTAKDSNGNVIASTNYTVTYPAGCTNVGRYTVRVTFKGNYSGYKDVMFKIFPPRASLSKVKAGKKAFTAKWAKKPTQVDGYEIQYSTSSSFMSGNKTVVVKSAKTTSMKIKKLTAKKKYYVRIRTYKVANRVKFYSAWSAKKSVTVKK